MLEYVAGDAAEIPVLVSRATAGDYRRLNERISAGGPILQLMYWSIWCNEPWVGLGAKGPLADGLRRPHADLRRFPPRDLLLPAQTR